MKKASLKRLGIGLLQHILAAGIMAVVAMILLNSYITVNSIDGTMVYRIFPMDADQEFEESDIYHDLFRNAVSDITQLVVVKEQMESNDVFDPHKKINVTEYARQIGEDQDCAVSVVYELEDIIKWGKYGVEHTNRMMSMSEFVNYFGYCIYPENFILDEYGKLAFDGFHRIEEISDDEKRDCRRSGADQGSGRSQSVRDRVPGGRYQQLWRVLSGWRYGGPTGRRPGGAGGQLYRQRGSAGP